MLSTDGTHIIKDPMTTAYRAMLERVHALIGQPGDRVSALRADLEFAKEKAVELSELSREEAERILIYLERDLRDAAIFIANTGHELRQWWRFDLQQMEHRLSEMFISVADKTSVQLQTMNEELRHTAVYLANEITGPGTLVCRNCGHEFHFIQPTRIKVCINCHNTEFVRIS